MKVEMPRYMPHKLSTYAELYAIVNEKFPVYYESGCVIKAVYAYTQDDLELIKRYFTLAHSWPSMPPGFINYTSSVWRGPDWYFDIFEPGDSYGPCIAYMQSLYDKIENFNSLQDMLFDLKKEKELNG